MLHVCYSPKYFANTHTNSMEKLTSVANHLQNFDYIQLHEPSELNTQLLYQIHAPEYVDAVLNGESTKLATMAGFKPWNINLKNAILSVNAGQIKAAELAFQYGISANIAQGFHHAMHAFGGSFCTFNGLALVAEYFKDKRIFVLDCDQHVGDGTTDIARRMDNLFNYSIYGHPYGVDGHAHAIAHLIDRKKGCYAEYEQAIYDGFSQAIAWKADLIIYQAGMDCHQHDRFGSAWFSTALIEQRDELVFQLAKKNQIPLFFVLAGGYQSLEKLVPLHVKTFEIAHRVYEQTAVVSR